MGMGVSSRKNQKMPGAHKIGAAISGPRITGGNFMDITLCRNLCLPVNAHEAKLQDYNLLMDCARVPSAS